LNQSTKTIKSVRLIDNLSGWQDNSPQTTRRKTIGRKTTRRKTTRRVDNSPQDYWPQEQLAATLNVLSAID
jgi:hypothetical protein